MISGLGGVPEYEENFLSWSESAEQICRDELSARTVRMDGREARRDQLLAELEEAARRANEALWVFLIGHGTYDGRDYKFNIRGPDLTGSDLELVLETVSDCPVYLVLATSSSGILLDELSGSNRVIVSATKSARERHPPLFMSFFIEGALSAEADSNKDRRISLREVFDFSQAGVESWYEEKNRLQTEHPVLKEGDGSESGLANFAYLSSPPEQAYRTLEARQLAPEKTRLEREIEALKLRKTEMSSETYYQELQRLLVELAELNERISELEGEAP